MKIAVIGGGMAGLVAIKYSKSLGLDVTCYEKSSEIGGSWLYNEKIASETSDIHSAMYKNLRSNLPHQLMCFSDFENNEGSGPTSYITHNEMLEFLKKYSNHFGLLENIKFRHLVTNVAPVENEKWEIKAQSLTTNELTVDVYDAVFVANGQYFDPRSPKLSGIENFKGEVMHSHTYRKPDKFSNKRVLIIGSGPSGTDISLDIATTTELVYFSHHKDFQFEGYPLNVVQKPDVVQISSDGLIEFKDGSHCMVDAIVFCTGYNFKFPFLSPECHIEIRENHIRDLYKHVVNIYHPTMFFLAIPFEVPIAPTVELQVQFSLRFLLNPRERPSKIEMLKDNEDDIERLRTERKWNNKILHQIGPEEMEVYWNFLTTFTQLPPIKPVLFKLTQNLADRIIRDPVNLRRYKHTLLNNEEYSEEMI